MGKNLTTLLSISSAPFSLLDDISPSLLSEMAGAPGMALADFLRCKNGFFAFEASLRVFPFHAASQSMSVFEWNASSLWRNAYGQLLREHWFFAEDIFGGQFCIFDQKIYAFEPETGALTAIANTLEEWAGLILSDYPLWTGYPLGHAWQATHGALPSHTRLVPKVPFVCGGEFSIENLSAVSAVTGMRLRGNLASQIANLPDGAQIEYQIIE